jgi:hypothetical protein
VLPVQVRERTIAGGEALPPDPFGDRVATSPSSRGSRNRRIDFASISAASILNRSKTVVPPVGT